MGLYSRYIVPKITHFLCRHEIITKQRRKIVPRASGRVLEIGIGSGLNLPFYNPETVEHVWGLDPSREMWKLADIGNIQFKVEFLEASAERIPLDDAIANTIVVTYSLCTVSKVIDVLREMRRVLSPGGELIFCEHGAAPEERVRRWQNRLNPVWKKIAGGCNLNRQIPELLEQEGFKILGLDAEYIPGMKFASFNYSGTAV